MTRQRVRRRRSPLNDILHFLYAAASVKSNPRTGVDVLRIVRIVAVVVLWPGALVYSQTVPPLTIADEALPSLDPGVEVRVPLSARGGVPPYRWSITSGELPEGISLTPDGFLVGRPPQTGR